MDRKGSTCGGACTHGRGRSERSSARWCGPRASAGETCADDTPTHPPPPHPPKRERQCEQHLLFQLLSNRRCCRGGGAVPGCVRIIEEASPQSFGTSPGDHHAIVCEGGSEMNQPLPHDEFPRCEPLSGSREWGVGSEEQYSTGTKGERREDGWHVVLTGELLQHVPDVHVAGCTPAAETDGG